MDNDAEKNYDEIDLSPEKFKNDEELESKLKDNYNKPITLNSLNKKDVENVKDIYNQLSRLQYCVQNIKYNNYKTRPLSTPVFVFDFNYN